MPTAYSNSGYTALAQLNEPAKAERMKGTAASLTAFSASRVDADAMRIYGVAAITIGEAQGHGLFVDRRTLETVLAEAQKSTSGIRVVDTHSRRVTDTMGLATNWRIDGDVLRCDVEFFAASADRAGPIIALAEKAPDTFGLSITFYDDPEKIEGRWFSRCTKLVDISIVDVPAANANGLFGARVTATSFSALRGTTKLTTMPYSPEEIASIIDALKAEVAAIKAMLGETEDMAAKLAAISDTVTALSAKVETEVRTFGTRAAALEQHIAPRDTRPAGVVKFESAVKAAREKNTKLTANMAIAEVARTDREAYAAWVEAGRPKLA